MTTDEILSAINWAIGNLQEQGIQRNSYLFKEHHFGMYNFGYTMTLCDEKGPDLSSSVIVADSKASLAAALSGEVAATDRPWPYANIDYDSRCDCCGAMSDVIGSEDIYRGKEREAAEKIAKKFALFTPACSCHEGF